MFERSITIYIEEEISIEDSLLKVFNWNEVFIAEITSEVYHELLNGFIEESE